MSFDEVREVLEILIKHLEKQGISKIDLTADYYWQVDSREIFEFTETPGDLSLGQLTFDIENLKGLLAQPEMVVGHGFSWLGSVLTALGYQHGR